MLTAAFLLSLPQCFAERADPARVEHVALLAEAIDQATEKPAERAALATIAYYESGLCWAVATGKVRGGQGPWQIEPGSHRPGPYVGSSLPELTHAARQALWLWRHSWQCGPSPRARFRAYAGLECSSSWTGARVRERLYFFASNQLQVLAQ
jgi:hypothetical protein